MGDPIGRNGRLPPDGSLLRARDVVTAVRFAVGHHHLTLGIELAQTVRGPQPGRSSPYYDEAISSVHLRSSLTAWSPPRRPRRILCRSELIGTRSSTPDGGRAPIRLCGAGNFPPRWRSGPDPIAVE